eukprot:365255-Chlamydomonas_euryale.AAC.19
MLGPNPAYANESFYMANIHEDEKRVQRLFEAAPGAGIAMRQRSLASNELQGLMLTGTCLVIALVDRRKLQPWVMCADVPSLVGYDGGYLGHYVLIIGFDPVTDEYIVRDPAGMDAEQRLAASSLDQARMSFGTDEDLIIVPLRCVHGHGDSCEDPDCSTCITDALLERVELEPCEPQ